MAYLNTTTAPSIIERTLSGLSGLVTRFKQYRMYRETFEGLSALSNRELADLGLNRADLRRVAWESSHR